MCVVKTGAEVGWQRDFFELGSETKTSVRQSQALKGAFLEREGTVLTDCQHAHLGPSFVFLYCAGARKSGRVLMGALYRRTSP